MKSGPALDGDYAPHALIWLTQLLTKSQKGEDEKDGSGDGAVGGSCFRFCDIADDTGDQIGQSEEHGLFNHVSACKGALFIIELFLDVEDNHVSKGLIDCFLVREVADLFHGFSEVLVLNETGKQVLLIRWEFLQFFYC